MIKYKVLFSVIVAASCLSTAAAQAPDATSLTLSVQPLFYRDVGTGKTNPTMIVAAVAPEDDFQINPDAQSRYSIVQGKHVRLFRRIRLEMNGAPKGYRGVPLEVRVPFYVHTLKIYSVATNSQPGDSGEISALRQQDPNVLKGSDLFRYYARANQQFGFYINKQPGESRDGVKAIYSFLQSARGLIKTQYLVPSDEVNSGSAWLKGAIDNAPTVVNSAVGLHNAKQVLSESESIALEGYATVWREVSDYKIANRLKYCSLLGLLQDDIEDQTEDFKAQIYAYKSLGPIIATAFAECVAADAKEARSADDKSAATEKIETQIKMLEDRKGALAGTEIEWSAKIDNRIEELASVRDALAVRNS